MFVVDGARVVVTGGTGFLGQHVARQLHDDGADVVALGHADYDLRERAQIAAMLRDLRPDAVIHLAAIVGGIGANQAEPGRFFYENALMGIELLEACRIEQVSKVVIAGTVCAYPVRPEVPFREADLWAGYPEETNAPVRAGEADAPRAGPGVPRAVRLQLRVPAAHQPLRAR